MEITLNCLDVWPLCCAIDTRIDFLKSIEQSNPVLYHKCLYDVEVERLRALRNVIFAKLK